METYLAKQNPGCNKGLQVLGWPAFVWQSITKMPGPEDDKCTGWPLHVSTAYCCQQPGLHLLPSTKQARDSGTQGISSGQLPSDQSLGIWSKIRSHVSSFSNLYTELKILNLYPWTDIQWTDICWTYEFQLGWVNGGNTTFRCCSMQDSLATELTDGILMICSSWDVISQSGYHVIIKGVNTWNCHMLLEGKQTKAVGSTQHYPAFGSFHERESNLGDGIWIPLVNFERKVQLLWFINITLMYWNPMHWAV